MTDIHHEGELGVPAAVAFAYVDDHRNTSSWLFGMSEFEHVGGTPGQVGARYKGHFQVKPVSLTSTVEVTEYVPDELIAYRSVSGFTNASQWRFQPIDDERSRIIVDLSYELPGGIAGKVMGRAFGPVVALSVRHSDDTLRRRVEQSYRA